MAPPDPSPRLLLLPTLPAVQEGDQLILTAKFRSGWQAFVDAWPGPVDTLFRPIEATTDNLDNTAYRSRELPGRAVVAPFDSARARQAIEEADLVLGGTVVEQLELAALAGERGVPFVATSEYSVETRCQIARAEERNPLKRWRRQSWERGLEKRLRRLIPELAGLQCNGTPTYDAYRSLNPNALLFFDSRIDADMLASDAELDARDQRRRVGLPLRLAFSGRLIAMKGVQHLTAIARELERAGVDFDLEVFGDGDLRAPIAAELAGTPLERRVQLRGTVDFKHKLIPHLRREIDLFICPHVQGDPSCTYLETWAAGVPIVGFGNEAFTGLLQRVDAGRATPLGDAAALARAVAEAAGDPARLAAWARAGRDFAAEHTADRTFRARVEHLVELEGSASRQSA
ncbi:MAG: glycosyltransferase [Planctomycetota bacterium]|jgi:glycosyltransferase involved in cell wall biosynthesis